MRWMFVFLVLGFAFPAWAGLRVDCPECVGIGLPFTVRVGADQPLSDVRIRWQKKTLVVPVNGENATTVLLGTDVLKSSVGTAILRVDAGTAGTLERPVRVLDREFPEQRLTVPPAMATPPKIVRDRIAKEYAQSRAVLGTVSPVRFLTLPLVRPVPGTVSSAYGLRRFFNGQPRNPHRGLDLLAAQGDPIGAVAAGKVVLTADHYYAGRCVYLDHGLGVHSLYMHMDTIRVREGELVEAGQPLGTVGMTGRVTGPHLHLGLTILDLSVDPLPLFDQSAGQ